MMNAITARAEELDVQILQHSADKRCGENWLRDWKTSSPQAATLSFFRTSMPRASAAVVETAKEKGIVVVSYDSYNENAD